MGAALRKGTGAAAAPGGSGAGHRRAPSARPRPGGAKGGGGWQMSHGGLVVKGDLSLLRLLVEDG